MNRMDVKVWLRKHRFKRSNVDVYEAPYDGCHIRVDVGQTDAVTSVITDGMRRVLRHYRLRDVSLDEHGMLVGAGLKGPFIEQVKRGRAFPKWFPETAVKAIREKIDQELKRAIPPRRKPMARVHVVEWALLNGFRQKGLNILEADFDDTTITLLVKKNSVLLSRSGNEGLEALSGAKFTSLRIDGSGMLRGVGLVACFIDDVLDGKEVPGWFPKDFVNQHLSALKAAGFEAGSVIPRSSASAPGMR